MLSRLRFGGLQVKLLLLVQAASLPVLFLLFWLVVQDRESAIESAKAGLAKTAHVTSLNRERYFEGAQQVLRTISRTPALQDGSPEACTEYLRDLQGRVSALFNFGVVDLDGNLRCNALFEGVKGNVSDRPFFRRARDYLEFTVSAYTTGRFSGQKNLQFGYPLFDRSNAQNIVGVVFASLDLTAHEQTLADLISDRSATLTFTDRNGVILGSYPPAPEKIGTRLPNVHLLDSIGAAKPVIVEHQSEGGTKYLHAIDVVRVGNVIAMHTVLSMSLESVVSKVNRKFYWLTATLVAALGGVMLISWLLGERWIVQRASLISAAALRIGKGEHGVRTGLPAGRDELDQIGHAFDRMAESLERRETDLLVTNRRLTDAQRIAKLGHWEFDIPSSRGWWSRQSSGIFPPETADYTFEDFFKWVHAEDKKRVTATYTELITAGNPVDIEYRTVGSSGKLRWVRVIGECILVADGKPARIAGILQDVTARKQTEGSLKLLYAAVNRANDIVLITEAEPINAPGPRIVFVNDAFARRTGYSREEAVGNNPRFLQGPETSRDTLDRIHAALKQWKPTREELVNYTKDGTPFWLELDLTPIADESGRFTHWVAIERDITERKRTVAALIASEERYRVLFESSPLPLWLYDPDTLRFLDVNDVACACYGYTRREFMAMTIRDIRPPDDTALLESNLAAEQAIVASSGPWRHQRKDGTVIMVEINSHEIAIHGRRARFVCPVDITEKVFAKEEILRMNLLLERKVELRTEELSRSLSLQQSLFDNVPQIVWLADLDGAITFANRVWSEKIGIVDTDWKGHGWGKAVHPEDIDRVSREWREAAPTKHNFEIEYRFLHRDGEYHHYQVDARKVFDKTGDPICWVGVCTDVTDSRRREAALQFANQELEAFSSSVSHDLRAPLRTIDGFSERLQIESAGQLDEQGRHYLARIRRGAANMNELIDDLLSLSQITRAGMAMAKVDLSKLAQQVFVELRQQQPDHPMEIVIQEHMNVIGDARLLQVVLVNLIGNAMKFSAKRAVIRIVVGENVLPGDMSMFFVQDNGAGFDPSYATKMFGVFQRLHSATEFPGTGIGLATVQRIIQRHGGRVSAEGAVDQGAKIYFSLRRE